MLNAVLFIAAAGEGAADHCVRHISSRNRNLLLLLLFLHLSLSNIFHLFLHRGEQLELQGRSIRRRRNGRLIACRLLLFWIYLYTISVRTISSAWTMKLFTA